MKISTFATDGGKETNGVWVDVNDAAFLIARIGNPNFVAYVREHGKGLAQAMNRKAADPESLRQIELEAISKTVLLGWRNIQDDEGNDIPYSHAKALEFLSQHRDFYEMIVDFAKDVSNFRRDEIEKIQGNS